MASDRLDVVVRRPYSARMRAPLRRLAFSLTAFAALSVASACAGKVKSGTDYDQSTKFADYSTYAWITDDLVLIRPGTGNENIRNVDNEKRIRAAVEQRLNGVGMSMVPKEEASMLVSFQVGTRERLEVGGVSFQFGAPDPTYTEGTLSVDLFDAASGNHLWSGWASKGLYPGDDPDAITAEAINAIFDGFPP